MKSQDWFDVAFYVLCGLFLFWATVDAKERFWDNHVWEHTYPEMTEQPVKRTVSIATQAELDAMWRSGGGSLEPGIHALGIAIITYQEDEAGNKMNFQCDIYILSFRDVRTLRHEIRHCEGWTHN